MSATSAAAALPSSRPSLKVATAVSLVAVPAAVAISGPVVAQSSYSACSATTANPANSYQIACTVTARATDDTQGGAAAVGFTWEARNV